MQYKILFLIFVTVFIIGFTTALTNEQLKTLIGERFYYADANEIIPVSKWNFQQISYEQGINVTIYEINDNDLQIDIINTNGGGYKFSSVVCEISSISQITKEEYNPATNTWTDTGILQKGNLIDYGLPNWCETGYILFTSTSQDKKIKLKFPEGEKSFKIYTGTGTDEIIASYGSEEYINGIIKRYFTVGDGKNITMVSSQ